MPGWCHEEGFRHLPRGGPSGGEPRPKGWPPPKPEMTRRPHLPGEGIFLAAAPARKPATHQILLSVGTRNFSDVYDLRGEIETLFTRHHKGYELTKSRALIVKEREAAARDVVTPHRYEILGLGLAVGLRGSNPLNRLKSVPRAPASLNGRFTHIASPIANIWWPSLWECSISQSLRAALRHSRYFGGCFAEVLPRNVVGGHMLRLFRRALRGNLSPPIHLVKVS